MSAENFEMGDLVVYGSYGRCEILGVEETRVGEEVIKCYKMKKFKKTNLPGGASSRATFLVPIKSAQNGSLRKPVSADCAEETLAVLKSTDRQYVNLDGNWLLHQRRYDEMIRREGAQGMAKTLSELAGYLSQTVVPTKSITNYYETIKRQLTDEFAEAMDIPSKDCEVKLSKALKYNN